MKVPFISSSAVRHALSGLAIQILCAGLLLGGLFFEPPESARYLFWTAIAGVFVWMQALSAFWIRDRTSRLETKSTHNRDENTTGDKPVRSIWVARLAQKIHRKFLLIFLNTAAGGAYGYGAYLWFLNRGSSPGPISDPLPFVALYASAAFGAMIMAVYFLRLSLSSELRPLRAPALQIPLLALLFCLPLAEALFIYAEFPRIRLFVQPVIPVCNGILATEKFAAILLWPLQPHRVLDAPPALSQSYFLEVLFNPRRIGGTTRDVLSRLLGFDVSTTTLYRFGRRLAVPLIFLSAALLALLSTVVIIEPGKQGVVLCFGRISGPVRGPGLHIKPPWPVGSTRIVDTDRVRRIHVGSHRPKTPEASVFKEGVPLLWTNMHGVRREEFLIVASPKRLIISAVESGGKLDPFQEGAPSVSLAGADIVVEYVVSDLRSYLTAHGRPDQFLRILAEAHVSSHILRYEIDDLFSDKRFRMAKELRTEIQESCDEVGLGISILHVGITAVHPPIEIADAFEENVSARQDRETKIQQARQIAVRSQVETAGSVTDFENLIALIEKEEAPSSGDRAETEQLLLSCGGSVAGMLAEAVGYRWSREDGEGGKMERFVQESNLFRISPGPYRYERYLSVLESNLTDKKKILLTGTHRNAVLGVSSGFPWSIENLFIKREPQESLRSP